MKYKQILFLLLAIFTFSCSSKIDTKNHYFTKDGQKWFTSEIYGYVNGKRTLVRIETSKKEDNSSEETYDLIESVLFYERWPNNEYKFVSTSGFKIYENGIYFLDKDSVVVPDNVIYEYSDKDFVKQIEVYKGGKRIKYTQGYYDGHQTMHISGDKPGVYIWKDGKEYFEREFSEQELESHKEMDEFVKRRFNKDTTITK